MKSLLCLLGLAIYIQLCGAFLLPQSSTRSTRGFRQFSSTHAVDAALLQSETVSVLQGDDHRQEIYLIGTAHISSDSASQVADIISSVKVSMILSVEQRL